VRHNRLTIKINRPPTEVLAFLSNPKNAPNWMDSVKSETASEWPPRLGTTYRDHDVNGKNYEYEVTAYKAGELIELSQAWGYHERITLNALDSKTTELKYHEWVDDGELPELTGIARLETLKRLVEADG
jgi:hypothetical protein